MSGRSDRWASKPTEFDERIRMRKTSKILHTLASCGLIGGLACHMILLVYAPQDTPVAYAELRQSIAAISNYVLLPSLALGLVTGLFSMAIHTPFLSKGWVLIKALLGILMFKGVLTVVVAKSDYVAVIAERIANGEPAAEALERALAGEWGALWVVMALSLVNVLLGVWRPAQIRLWPFGESGKSSRPAKDVPVEEAPLAKPESVRRADR
jgi:uncharacterized membrane protein